MNRAAILGFYFLSFGLLTPNGQSAGQPTAATSADSSSQQSQSSASASQQAPAQSSEPAQPASASAGRTSNPPAQAKPSPKQPKHHKKTVSPDCATDPPPMNTAVGSPTDATRTTNSDSGNAVSTNTTSTDGGSTNAASTNTGSAGAASTNTNSTALPPCPPPKKVVRNGGSDEPSIQLVGGETAEQSAHQSATDKLTVATEENLKKVAGRHLSPSQQEMVSQIKLFMDQSKTAIAAGDVERGRNLAMKAHLLSDELVKP